MSAYSDAVLADAPNGYWHFGEPSGNFADSSGRNRGLASGSGNNGGPALCIGNPDGSVNTGTLASGGAPQAGGAWADHDLGDVWTLEAWIKRADSGTGPQSIVSKAGGAYQMRSVNNRLTMTRSGVADIVTATVTFADALVHHCVVVKNAAVSAKIYLDGVDVTGTITNNTCVNTGIALSVGHDNGSQAFNGNIDEVAIYPTALSAARVLAHYNAGLLPPVSAYSNLVVADGATFYFRLGEPSGTAAADFKGALAPATYTGSVVLGQPGAISGDADTSVLFGPTNAFVSAAAAALHQTGFQAGYSVEAWIYPTAALGAGIDTAIVGHAYGPSNMPYLLVYGSAQSQYGNGQHLWGASFNGAMDGKVSEATDMPLNQWHHIVFTCAGSNGATNLYRNGNLIASSALSGAVLDANQVMIFGKKWDVGNSFPGRIDEVAVYKGVVLTPAKIRNHYSLGAPSGLLFAATDHVPALAAHRL